jgi:hypothetical protein
MVASRQSGHARPGGSVARSDPMDEPRSVKVSVTFTAVVLAVESCTIGDVPVRLSRGANDKWSGDAPIVPSPDPRPFRLTFRAPSRTDYDVVVKARGVRLLESSDTSDRSRFTITETIVVPLAADA